MDKKWGIVVFVLMIYIAIVQTVLLVVVMQGSTNLPLNPSRDLALRDFEGSKIGIGENDPCWFECIRCESPGVGCITISGQSLGNACHESCDLCEETATELGQTFSCTVSNSPLISSDSSF